MAQDDVRKLIGLLRDFDTAMLITHAGNDRLHGRPMAVAQVEDNGDLWFLSGFDTPKTMEIQGNDHVLVTFQEGRDKVITVSGRAQVERDPLKIEELWREHFKVWFPQGKDDPNLVLIHVRGQEAEYWDNAGANKVAYAFEALGAYMTGSTPDIKEGQQHGRVPI
jgi:general stress protein 26